MSSINTNLVKKWGGAIFAFLTLLIVFSLPLIPIAYGQGSYTAPSGSNRSLQNPLSGVSDIPTLIGRILDVVVEIGGYVAVIALIWTGFLFVKAQGNKDALTDAKRAFFYTVIGVAILIGAKALSLAITGTLRGVLRTSS